VAEVFASEHLFQMGFRLSQDDFSTRAWGRVIDGVQRWPDRKSVWTSIFDVKLSSFPRWSDLDALILARNVIAHGLGTLTRRQQISGVPRKEIVDKLRRLSIEIDGLEIVVDEPQVERCARLVIEFIVWLDDLTQGHAQGGRAVLAS
jgi:hypothetical protein